MAYHQFVIVNCKALGLVESTGSFETFQVTRTDGEPLASIAPVDTLWGPGWYWWPCFPGCLPDGDPVGPFATEQGAIEDANDID